MLKSLFILAIVLFCALAWWLTILNPVAMVVVMIIVVLVTSFRNHIVDFFVHGLFKDINR